MVNFTSLIKISLLSAAALATPNAPNNSSVSFPPFLVNRQTSPETQKLDGSHSFVHQEKRIGNATFRNGGSALIREKLDNSDGGILAVDAGDCAMDCQFLVDLGPPPDMILFLPPPPLPSFMRNSPDVLAAIASNDDGSCPLCDWALLGDNETFRISSRNTGLMAETTWIPIIIVASLISALFGAILAVILLRCRTLRNLSIADSCPVVPRSYLANGSAIKSTNQDSGRNNNNSSRDSDRRSSDNSDTLTKSPKTVANAVTKVASGWKFWRRNSSQEHPLNPSGSNQGSDENSYCDEPYMISSNHGSALYAELNSHDSGLGMMCHRPAYSSCKTYMMGPYEMPCTERGPMFVRRLLPDGTYENAAYIGLSENGRCYIPGRCCGQVQNGTFIQIETDSDGTPTSAYYSDASLNNGNVVPVRNSRNNASGRGAVGLKKKNNTSINSSPLVVTTNAAAALLNNSVDSQNTPRDNNVLMHLLQQREAELCEIDKSGDFILDGAERGDVSFPHFSFTKARNHSGGLVNKIGGNTNTLPSQLRMDVLNRRPLPPLPSRQAQGPQKRNTLERPLPPIPSQYV